jgi:hypothetical protein
MALARLGSRRPAKNPERTSLHRFLKVMSVAAGTVAGLAVTALPVGAGATTDPYPPPGSSSGYQDTSLSGPTSGQFSAQWTNPSTVTCEHSGVAYVSSETYVGGTAEGSSPWSASASVRYSCANGTLEAPVAQIQLEGTVEQMSTSPGDHMAVTVTVPDGGNSALFVSLTDTTTGDSKRMATDHGFVEAVNDLFVGMDPTGTPKKIPRFGSVQFTDCVFHGQPLLGMANMTEVSMRNTGGEIMIGITPGSSGKGFRAGFRLEGTLATGD